MAREDLKWALKRFNSASHRRSAYQKAYEYYDGVQPIAFATEKFESAFFDVFKGYWENLCPPVVDALKDRLKVVGFRSSEAETENSETESPVPGAPPTKSVRTVDPLGQTAWDVWNRNRMDLRSAEVHEEAIKCGDAYVIVWPGEDMLAEIWPQYATEVEVEYDSNYLGVLKRGAKLWWDVDVDVWRINIYLPGSIEKYIQKQKQGEKSMTLATGEEHFDLTETVPNPYNRVPIFHFSNGCEYKHGYSQLRNVFPLQDGLNKSVIDMMVAMEFAAFKQRYVIGQEITLDEETGQPVDQAARNYGADRLLAFPDPEAKVGQFDSTDLSQFLKVQEKYWLTTARVTGTPLHYFYITEGDFPSGEAIKSAEGRFIRLIGDRQTSFGNRWEDALLFAMQIEGTFPEDLELSTTWENATPKSESELADTAVKKRTVGFSRSYLLREFGLSDEEIELMLEEADAERLTTALLKQQENPPPENGGPPTREQTRGRQGVPGAGGS